ncbi:MULTISPECIES: cyclopropane-fatty-acyl-phospholipid synthase family protein [Novosphingobium]|uniref:SAM-dependent methyltransferase n=1 Tax=Novosphingobium TaxID=165696 RepID=UPI00020EEDE9|nr:MULTISPECIES: cyclopropane-fatty-acyl-phospholipid synthase family protein [Novosphingobium]CCA93159.1 cyclopropane-fatty-acyl-phospholipid synthase [Novosphingobium sp. PP1Y]
MIQTGQLTVIDHRGRSHEFLGHRPGPKVTVRLHDPKLPLRLALNPSLAFGEAYMEGTLTLERGSLHDLLQLAIDGLEAFDRHPIQRLRARTGRNRSPRNHRHRARANVAHHYDLSGALYDLFLDSDRQYSCAYFPTGDETLEEAQAAKKRHLAAKLLLEPGCEVLDIGSGWGGLALELAQAAKANVTGVTLSTEQLAAARARAEAAGLSRQVRFELRDYREEMGLYDRVVSVGMFEHVGPPDYSTFFKSVARTLKPDGVALIHSIGRMEPPGGADPWISKYIFPGGYIPALSEVVAAVEKSGLWITDIEILRVHYADTLKHWHERFQARRAEAAELYDERFCRMWEFYLAACEMLFRHGPLMVFQLQLAHRRDAVPLTRDYITDYDRSEPVDAPLQFRQRA